MNAATLAQLLAQFGLPLTQYIYGLVHNGNKVVTDADWITINTLAQYRSSDSLAAAGISIVDGKVVSVPPSA